MSTVRPARPTPTIVATADFLARGSKTAISELNRWSIPAAMSRAGPVPARPHSPFQRPRLPSEQYNSCDNLSAMRIDPCRIEVMDDEMARILREKSGAERLRIASGLFASARRMLASHLAAEHPDWDPEKVQAEVARRLAGGAG